MMRAGIQLSGIRFVLFMLLCSFILLASNVSTAAMDSRWLNGGFKGFNLDKVKNSTVVPADFDQLANDGVNLLRIILNVRRCTGCDAYSIPELDKLYETKVISNAARVGIKVVIAFAIQPSGNNSDYWDKDIVKQQVADIWNKKAVAYKNNAVIAAFELLNEPVPPKSLFNKQSDIWNVWAREWVEAIRKGDPERTIIYEPAPWALPTAYKNLKPMQYDNIVYSFHFYSPHKITNQGLPGHDAVIEYPVSSYGLDGAWNKDRLSKLMDDVRNFSNKNNVPIYLGEFSCVRWAPGNTSLNYLKDVIELVEKERWSWTYHAYREYEAWDTELPSGTRSKLARSRNTPVFKMLLNKIRP